MKRLHSEVEHNKQIHQSSIRELELKIDHLTRALTERPSNQLPSNTEVNPKGKENAMAITLRSGKELKESPIEVKGKEVPSDHLQEEEASQELQAGASNSQPEIVPNIPDEEDIPPPPEVKAYVPPIPFPECLKMRKRKDEDYFKKFIELFRSLEVKMPFAEALANMPSYAKFLKDIVSSKEKL